MFIEIIISSTFLQCRRYWILVANTTQRNYLKCRRYVMFFSLSFSWNKETKIQPWKPNSSFYFTRENPARGCRKTWTSHFSGRSKRNLSVEIESSF